MISRKRPREGAGGAPPRAGEEGPAELGVERTAQRKAKDAKEGAATAKRSSKEALASRPNKNCPVEMSSKRPVKRAREVVEVKNRKVRDPRFQEGSGTLNYDMFRKAYTFLESYEDAELEALKKSLKKGKGKGKGGEQAAQMTAVINQIKQQKRERSQADATRLQRHRVKKEEREKVAEGKTPFFQKKSEQKQAALQLRFQELKESGRLKKTLEKKRKKNAAKDHRWLPGQRRTNAGSPTAGEGGGGRRRGGEHGDGDGDGPPLGT